MQKKWGFIGTVIFLAGWLGLYGVQAATFPTISASELKAKMDGGEKILLINPLSDIEFNEGYIPGSVNIPLHEMEAATQLPKDKGALIVTYCLGPK
jgi:rhodanese-related sulfurtransferase